MLERLAARPNGKLIAITGITPTKAGEGKTTTAVSLTEGLGFIGDRSLVCLREPSVGACARREGRRHRRGPAQVVPGEDINLHFTGDLHAIAAANNLLASAVDAHLVHGNDLRIDPANISWRRCLDIEDRLLRRVTIGVGEEEPFPRETGFDITAASEVMALMAMAADPADVRQRLGAITIGMTYDGEPVTAEQLEVAGAMAVLLKDTLKPNLVQTVEGQPALIHAGPFANIAHGNSSLVADLVGLKLADYVVTEGGFGSDLGFEKFVHIVCRAGGLTPDAVVLVATTRALKRHGGDPDGGLPALERGAENLAAHLRIVKEFGFEAVVAVNRFPDDSEAELDALARLSLEHGAFARLSTKATREAAPARRHLPRRLWKRRRGTRRPASCTSSRTRSRRSSMRSHGASTAARASSCPPRRARHSTGCRAPASPAHLRGQDPSLAVTRPGARRRAARLRPARARAAAVHRRGLDRGGLRRDTDDARTAVALRGRENGSRRRWSHSA